MNALHLQAMDIIPQIPEAMMGDVIDYLTNLKTIAKEYDEPTEELDLSGLPKSVNADKMTDEELMALFQKSEQELLSGQGIPFEEFDREFRKRHGI